MINMKQQISYRYKILKYIIITIFESISYVKLMIDWKLWILIYLILLANI